MTFNDFFLQACHYTYAIKEKTFDKKEIWSLFLKNIPQILIHNSYEEIIQLSQLFIFRDIHDLICTDIEQTIKIISSNLPSYRGYAIEFLKRFGATSSGSSDAVNNDGCRPIFMQGYAAKRQPIFMQGYAANLMYPIIYKIATECLAIETNVSNEITVWFPSVLTDIITSYRPSIKTLKRLVELNQTKVVC